MKPHIEAMKNAVASRAVKDFETNSVISTATGIRRALYYLTGDDATFKALSDCEYLTLASAYVRGILAA